MKLRSMLLLVTFISLATGLMILTLAWHVPMMLWDQLDMLPIHDAWQKGNLSESNFWSARAGHWHSIAYALLLATMWLSDGHPWLDCLLSWVFLIIYAGIVFAMIRQTLPCANRTDLAISLLLVFLVLYPGHLANLQGGWQIAVFICMVGAAVVVASLTRDDLTWRHLAIALLATAVACMSFATAFALFPTTMILIALRNEQTLRRRVAYLGVWLICGLSFLVWGLLSSPGDDSTQHAFFQTIRYALNFLGGGVIRFAPDFAPWLASVAIVTAFLAFVRIRSQSAGLPWLGLLLFGLFSAPLTALGRAGMYPGSQAFVTCYVSFSSVFWLGWVALIFLAYRASSPARIHWRNGLLAFVACCATVNAAEMIKKADRVAASTRMTAAALRATYPSVDEAILREIYFDQPLLARERLERLHELGYPPFD